MECEDQTPLSLNLQSRAKFNAAPTTNCISFQHLPFYVSLPSTCHDKATDAIYKTVQLFHEPLLLGGAKLNIHASLSKPTCSLLLIACLRTLPLDYLAARCSRLAAAKLLGLKLVITCYRGVLAAETRCYLAARRDFLESYRATISVGGFLFLHLFMIRLGSVFARRKFPDILRH